MKQVFVDTSAWSAIADASDTNHEIALLYKDDISEECRLVVTNYILDELYTLMLMNQGFEDTVDFQRQLDSAIQDGLVEVVWVLENIAAEAWTVFEKFNVDKHWSFTDCVSYVVMEQRDIKEAFTFDHHFEQMGFLKQP